MVVRIYDKVTKSYIGEIFATREQVREIEKDFIVK